MTEPLCEHHFSAGLVFHALLGVVGKSHLFTSVFKIPCYFSCLGPEVHLEEKRHYATSISFLT